MEKVYIEGGQQKSKRCSDRLKETGTSGDSTDGGILMLLANGAS
ncbi:MAG: hypothetical protein PQJ46_04830 [Spirochaetales bacterium]|nr:hypothetical protein [Spirochaetales bacterium]